MTILIFLIVSYILFSITMMKLFEKAGVEGKKALIPGVNFVEMCKLVGRKPSHALWLLFPVVNIFIYVGLCVDMVRSFGKYDFWHTALAVIFAPAMFYMIGNNKDDKYLGPTLIAEQEFKAKLEEAHKSGNNREFQKLQRQNPYVKSQVREWTEAIVFAVFAAAFIRMFLIEAYVIPTSSMEGSLKVGDFLFVSKAHYGIRTPKTVVMFPLLHNRLPFGNAESYLEKPNLPFYRLPALQEVERYDPVVFNFPDGDSVFIFPDRTFSIGDFRRGAVYPMYENQIKTGQKELVTRPIDKKDHYIKRCIGLPGDSIKVVNRQVYVNGQVAQNPTNMQYLQNFSASDEGVPLADIDEAGVSINEGLFSSGLFKLESKSVQILSTKYQNAVTLAQKGEMYQLTVSPEYNMTIANLSEFGIDYESGKLISGKLFLSATAIEKIKSKYPTVSITNYDFGIGSPGALFPHDEANFPGWSNDNYGPVYIPKKGATVAISPKNISLYRRVITIYEGNKLEVKGDKIFINGQEASSYTFKMNYYWMMGDNRHNSEDSRVWGFVPEDHIVGKPLFIWFSTKNGSIANGINWSRLFTGANKM